MQQMAQQLLNSLFDTSRQRQEQPSVSQTLSLQEQYAATQRQQQERSLTPSSRGQRQREHEEEAGFFGFGTAGERGDTGAGFAIIDDDEHPELRGRNSDDDFEVEDAEPVNEF